MPVTKIKAASAAIALTMLASLPVSAGVVEDRKANFKASNMSMRMMGAAMGSEDFDTITEEAMKLAAWAEVMPDYFPEGSGAGTSAKPEIWSDFVGFKDAAEAFHNAAQDLITVAAKQDAASTAEALKAVGTSCKACHQKFKSW